MGKTELRQLRKAKRLTLEQLAERTGISVSMLSRMETGERGITLEHVPVLASALNAKASDLLGGRTEVPVVGYVGAGHQVIPFGADEIDQVESPFGGQIEAVIVKGDSMYPVYRDRDLIFYETRTFAQDDLVGRECVLRLADGRMLVKVLRRGISQGFFTLESFNAPPIENVVVEWAAPVRWVEKR